MLQVYTYMLNPLTRSDVAQAGFSNQGGNSTAFWPQGQDIAGWELKLVMEYCDEVSNVRHGPTVQRYCPTQPGSLKECRKACRLCYSFGGDSALINTINTWRGRGRVCKKGGVCVSVSELEST